MWLLPFLILVTAVALSIPLSRYLAWIMDGNYRPPRWLQWFERRVDSGPQDWKQYTVALLAFNVNAAHPFENPTPLTNLLELLAIAVLPASLTYTFGRMTGRPVQGWVLFAVMLVLFAAGLLVCHMAE